MLWSNPSWKEEIGACVTSQGSNLLITAVKRGSCADMNDVIVARMDQKIPQAQSLVDIAATAHDSPCCISSKVTVLHLETHYEPIFWVAQ